MIRPDALWKGFRSLFYSLRFLSFLYTSGAISIIFIILLLSGAGPHKGIFYFLLIINILLIFSNVYLAYLLTCRWRDVAVVATEDRGEGQPPHETDAGSRFFDRLWPNLFLAMVWLLPVFLSVTLFLAVRQDRRPPGHLLSSSVHIALLISLDAIILSTVMMFISVFMQTQLKRKIEEWKRRTGGEIFPDEQRIPWDFGRTLYLELGIAFLVAGFITITYELMIRVHADEQAVINHNDQMNEIDDNHKKQMTEIADRYNHLIATIMDMNNSHSIEFDKHNREQLAAIEALHSGHLRDIERSVFRGLFGHDVEPKILNAIQSTVEAAKFVRKAFQISFDFEDLTPDQLKALKRPGDGDLVKITVTVSYDLHNTSSKPQAFPGETKDWNLYFENPIRLAGKPDQFLKLCISGCMDKEGYLRSGDYSTSALETEHLDDGVRRRLKIKPARFLVDSGNHPTNVEYVYETVRRVEDGHSWVSSQFIETIKITSHDHTTKNLGFCLEVIGKGDAHPRGKAGRHHEWFVEESMLPHQGMILYWFPQEAAQRAAPHP